MMFWSRLETEISASLNPVDFAVSVSFDVPSEAVKILEPVVPLFTAATRSSITSATASDAVVVISKVSSAIFSVTFLEPCAPVAPDFSDGVTSTTRVAKVPLRPTRATVFTSTVVTLEIASWMLILTIWSIISAIAYSPVIVIGSTLSIF